MLIADPFPNHQIERRNGRNARNGRNGRSVNKSCPIKPFHSVGFIMLHQKMYHLYHFINMDHHQKLYHFINMEPMEQLVS